MQVNINKDFQRYEEDVFMGLSLRQLLWSGASVAIAITVYFGLQPVLGQETVSWICIVVAAPFAMAGFFQYDQMTIWQFLKAVFVTEFLRSGPRVWGPKIGLKQSYILKRRKDVFGRERRRESLETE